jgi:hypothetical protein
MPVRASFQPSSPSGLVLGTGDLARARPPGRVPGASAAPEMNWRPRRGLLCVVAQPRKRERDAATAVKRPTFLELTSDQVGIPAELKHINKRRKRNQQGLPQ